VALDSENVALASAAWNGVEHERGATCAQSNRDSRSAGQCKHDTHQMPLSVLRKIVNKGALPCLGWSIAA